VAGFSEIEKKGTYLFHGGKGRRGALINHEKRDTPAKRSVGKTLKRRSKFKGLRKGEF